MRDSSRTFVEEDDFFRVEVHDHPSMLYVLWKRHLEGEELRERYLTLLSVIKRFRPLGWLGNARAVHYTTLQDARWMFEKFLPLLINSSVCRFARLEAPQSLLILDSLSLQDKIKSMADKGGGALEFRFFTDEELAISWLSSIEPTDCQEVYL